LSKLGHQAIQRGDKEGGVKLLREALRRDPSNARATALLNSNTSVKPTSTKGIVIIAQDEEDPFAELGDLGEDLGGDEDPFGGDVGGDDPFADDLGGDDVAPAEDLGGEVEPSTDLADDFGGEELEPTPAEPAVVTPVPSEPASVPDELVGGSVVEAPPVPALDWQHQLVNRC
jgi:hypothetical protein